MSSTPNEPFVAKLVRQTGEREFLAKVLRRAGDELENGSTDTEPTDEAELKARLREADSEEEAIEIAVEAVKAGTVSKDRAIELLAEVSDSSADAEADEEGDKRNEPEELHPMDDDLAKRAAPESLDELRQRCDPTGAEVNAYVMGTRGEQLRLWSKRRRGELDQTNLRDRPTDEMDDLHQRASEDEGTLADAFGMD